MSVYALVRIKTGARCYQDFSSYYWPPSDYGDEGKSLAGVADDCVFVAEKRTSGDPAYWDCRAPGAGQSGAYGNGSIFAPIDGVEFLTPMLGYTPELPSNEVSGSGTVPECLVGHEDANAEGGYAYPCLFCGTKAAIYCEPEYFDPNNHTCNGSDRCAL